MKEITKILEDLGIAGSAQKIYLSLLRDGEATARMLSERTGITRPSVYDQIKELRKFDLVGERMIEGKTYFAPLDVRKLGSLLDEKIEKLKSDKNNLDKNLKQLLQATRSPQPKIRFFEGRESMQQLMKDILWHDEISLSIYWPYTQMVEVLGEEFLTWFNERRIKYKISIKTIWPHKEKNKKHIFTDSDKYVQRRYANPGQTAKMGYLIYGDKVAFFSSTKETFGFLVESSEYAELMNMQFTNLWQSLSESDNKN